MATVFLNIFPFHINIQWLLVIWEMVHHLNYQSNVIFNGFNSNAFNRMLFFLVRWYSLSLIFVWIDWKMCSMKRNIASQMQSIPFPLFRMVYHIRTPTSIPSQTYTIMCTVLCSHRIIGYCRLFFPVSLNWIAIFETLHMKWMRGTHHQDTLQTFNCLLLKMDFFLSSTPTWKKKSFIFLTLHIVCCNYDVSPGSIFFIPFRTLRSFWAFIQFKFKWIAITRSTFSQVKIIYRIPFRMMVQFRRYFSYFIMMKLFCALDAI